MPEIFYPTVLCTALKHSNDTDWFHIYDLALSIHNLGERFSLFGPLTCSSDISLLELYLINKIYCLKIKIINLNMVIHFSLLESSVEDKNIKDLDDSVFVHGFNNNYVGRRLAFDYLIDNWQSLTLK